MTTTLIVGSPVWNGTVSTPIRTYIMENRESLRRTALFLTGYASDNRNIVTEVAGLLREKLLASIELDSKLVETGKYVDKLEEFLRSIKKPIFKEA